MECFQMLNGDRFRVYPSAAKTVCTDKLPGESLWEYMNRGTLTRPMLEAAGRELFRAHQFWSDELGGRWSHGDATMTNVIYNDKTRRARLVDFEIVHEKSLPAPVRQASCKRSVMARHLVPLIAQLTTEQRQAIANAEVGDHVLRGTGLAGMCARAGGVIGVGVVVVGIAPPSLRGAALLGAIPVAFAALAVGRFGIETRRRGLEEITAVELGKAVEAR